MHEKSPPKSPQLLLIAFMVRGDPSASPQLVRPGEPGKSGEKVSFEILRKG